MTTDEQSVSGMIPILMGAPWVPEFDAVLPAGPDVAPVGPAQAASRLGAPAAAPRATADRRKSRRLNMLI
jgi:hypothetical protein